MCSGVIGKDSVLGDDDDDDNDWITELRISLFMRLKRFTKKPFSVLDQKTDYQVASVIKTQTASNNDAADHRIKLLFDILALTVTATLSRAKTDLPLERNKVLHKLDQISTEECKKLEEKQRELLHPKVTTILKKRRQAAAANSANEKRTLELVTKPKALTGLFFSLALNMFLVLILYLTMPDKNSVFRIIHGTICLYAVIISRIFSSIWFSDIANASLKYAGVQTPSLSFGRTTGDFFTSILLDSMFFLQAILVNNVPVPFISTALAYLHMALLNSLFSFEYLWMSLGIGLRARIKLIERNWPYFLGYGTLLTIFTSLTESMMVNALLFGALFPFCIISSYLVHPSVYEQATFPYVHIFGPSIATTNYMTESFSAFLKSTGNKNITKTQAAKTSRIFSREHHSHSPLRFSADFRSKHLRSGSSME